MSRDVLLLIHPTLGAFGIFASLWVLVEVIGLDPAGLRRTRVASLVVPGLMLATWLGGGLWDAAYYPTDQKILDRGNWSFAGNTAMEFKEHLFALILMLALYLPIVVFRGNLPVDRESRLMAAVVSGLIVLSGLAMEGAGAILGLSVKVALVQGVGG
jgi:hypothetical protein